ncbi:hypothetical protein ACVRYP_03170 [Streptococcus rifensis]
MDINRKQQKNRYDTSDDDFVAPPQLDDDDFVAPPQLDDDDFVAPPQLDDDDFVAPPQLDDDDFVPPPQPDDDEFVSQDETLNKKFATSANEKNKYINDELEKKQFEYDTAEETTEEELDKKKIGLLNFDRVFWFSNLAWSLFFFGILNYYPAYVVLMFLSLPLIEMVAKYFVDKEPLVHNLLTADLKFLFTNNLKTVALLLGFKLLFYSLIRVAFIIMAPITLILLAYKFLRKENATSNK